MAVCPFLFRRPYGFLGKDWQEIEIDSSQPMIQLRQDAPPSDAALILVEISLFEVGQRSVASKLTIEGVSGRVAINLSADVGTPSQLGVWWLNLPQHAAAMPYQKHLGCTLLSVLSAFCPSDIS